MKINTGIITILKIKIENGTLVSIFKCLQYIDQAQPGSFFFCGFFWVKSVETVGVGGGMFYT